jgi:N-terminal region of micro-spherule protein
MQAGASLEALAKGAVNFTRRFSLKELQERWQALLYDSDVSTEVFAHMIDYEYITSSNPSIKQSADHGPNLHKRTADSVRSLYYSMRKRICTYQPSETAAVDELPQYDLESHDILPFLSDQSGEGTAFEPPPDYTDSLLMSPKICPNIEDGEEFEMVGSDGDRKSGVERISQDPDPFWQSIQREEQQEAPSQAKETRSSTEIMDDLIDFQMDFGSDLFFIDEGAIADTSCSIYLNSPQDELVNHTGGPIAVLPATESICADGNNAINKACNSVAVEVVPLEEKFTVCVLNTEDWDIPDNDHLNSNDVLNPNVHHNTNPNPSLNPNNSANKNNLDIAASSAVSLTDGRPTTGGLIGIKAMEPVIPAPTPVTVPSLIPVPAILEPLKATEPSTLPEKVLLVSMVGPSSSSLECGPNQVQASNVIRQNSTVSNELNPPVNEGTVAQDMGNRGTCENPKETEPVQAANQMDYYSNPVSLPMGCNPGTGGQFDVPQKCEPSTQVALIVGGGEHDISGIGPAHALGSSPGLGPDLPIASTSDHEGQHTSEDSSNEVPDFSVIEAMV